MKGVFKCAMEDDERRSRSVKRSSLGMPPCNSPVFTKNKIFVFGVNCLIDCFVCGVCIPGLTIGDYFPPSYLVSDGDRPLPPRHTTLRHRVSPDHRRENR